jgi:hypothetical protein
MASARYAAGYGATARRVPPARPAPPGRLRRVYAAGLRATVYGRLSTQHTVDGRAVKRDSPRFWMRRKARRWCAATGAAAHALSHATPLTRPPSSHITPLVYALSHASPLDPRPPHTHPSSMHYGAHPRASLYPPGPRCTCISVAARGACIPSRGGAGRGRGLGGGGQASPFWERNLNLYLLYNKIKQGPRRSHTPMAHTPMAHTPHGPHAHGPHAPWPTRPMAHRRLRIPRPVPPVPERKRCASRGLSIHAQRNRCASRHLCTRACYGYSATATPLPRGTDARHATYAMATPLPAACPALSVPGTAPPARPTRPLNAPRDGMARVSAAASSSLLSRTRPPPSPLCPLARVRPAVRAL